MRRTAGPVVAVVAAWTAGCASGGGGPPVTGPEADALFAELSGLWVLDEEESAAPLADLPELRSFEFTVGDPRANRAAAAQASYLDVTDATYSVLRRRPDTLELRVDETALVYMPTPGDSLAVPMNGESVVRAAPRRRTVRTRVVWEETTLALDHRTDARGDVRVTLRVVAGRLVMSRRVRGMGAAVAPVVLVYDRVVPET